MRAPVLMAGTLLTCTSLAAAIIRDLDLMGFEFSLALGDSLYGESGSNFVSVLHELELPYVLAIRSNHAVWLPRGQSVRSNRWRAYVRTFSDGQREQRYIREIVYGKRRSTRYWQLTSDPETLPSASTWMVMTHVEGITYKQVGDLYGLRNWVEYGFKQSKNELGWADFRMTHYAHIEKWWELVMSAYWMVTLYTPPLQPPDYTPPALSQSAVVKAFVKHRDWEVALGWKNWLNNLRLILLPWVSFNRLKPWLDVFPTAELEIGFERLVALMNVFSGAAVRLVRDPPNPILSVESH